MVEREVQLLAARIVDAQRDVAVEFVFLGLASGTSPSDWRELKRGTSARKSMPSNMALSPSTKLIISPCGSSTFCPTSLAPVAKANAWRPRCRRAGR